MEKDPAAELVVFTDASGNKYKVTKYEDIYFPVALADHTFYENTKELHKLNACQNDVFIIGYAKSGTHWVYEMIGMLLNGTTETIAKVKEMTMVDIKPIDEVNGVPSPRIFNTHYWPKHLPLDLLTKCKLVYLLRNPKDVAVSKYNHIFKVHPRTYDGNFHDFLGLFMESKVSYGSWFEYVRTFEEFFDQHPEMNPLILYYEDIIMDPIGAVRKLAKHLNVEHPEEFLVKVAEECHFDKMLLNNMTKRQDFTAEHTIDGKSPMYRKGKVGDWKNWFMVTESEKFDALFKEKMKGSKLKFKFELCNTVRPPWTERNTGVVILPRETV